MRNRIFTILLILAGVISAQDVDIVKQLKMVEKGMINRAQVDLENLKTEYPDHPDIIFLDAVLTADGKIAYEKYSRVYRIYPDSRFADASVFRMFSYHFALGSIIEATKYKVILEDEYPRSPYIKIASKNLRGFEQQHHSATAQEKNKKQYTSRNPDKKTEANFTIQAGAFISKENANKLIKLFSDRGFPTNMLKKDVAGSVLNIVTVGEFESIDEARTALQSINREYDIKGRIIKPGDYN